MVVAVVVVNLVGDGTRRVLVLAEGGGVTPTVEVGGGVWLLVT